MHSSVIVDAREDGAVSVLRGGIKDEVLVHHLTRNRVGGFGVIYKKVIPHNFYTSNV